MLTEQPTAEVLIKAQLINQHFSSVPTDSLRPHATSNSQVHLRLCDPAKGSIIPGTSSRCREVFLKRFKTHQTVYVAPLLQVGNISGLLNTLSPLGPITSRYPMTFEEVKQVRRPCEGPGADAVIVEAVKLAVPSLVFSTTDTCCIGPRCRGASPSPRRSSRR